LSRLVLSELFTAVVCVVAAAVALGRLSTEVSYMHNYVFAPLIDISEAFAPVKELDAVTRQQPNTMENARRAAGRLRTFIDRYRRDWKVIGSTSPEATRFRAIATRGGHLALLNEEEEAVDAFLVSLHRVEQSIDLAERAPMTPIPSGDVVDLSNALVR